MTATTVPVTPAPSLTAIVRTERSTAIRLGILTLAAVLGFVAMPWVKAHADGTTFGVGKVGDVETFVKTSVGLMKAFAVAGWIPVVGAYALSWVAFLRRDRRAQVISAVLFVVGLLWLVLWYKQLAGKAAFSPSTGYVFMLVAMIFGTVGGVKQWIGGSPTVTGAIGKALAPLGRVASNKGFQPGLAIAIVLFAALVIPTWFDSYWVGNFTQMAITAAVAASTSLLYGRVGLVSLGQVAPFGIGTWVTARLAYGTHLPFPVLLLIGGVIAAVVGVIIGLPALRVSGLYLALVTLMLAAAIELVLRVLQFPNGGGGFKGVSSDLTLIRDKQVRRPSIATTDVTYFRYVVVAVLILFGIAVAFLATRPGRAWSSIKQSEAAALSTGIDITRFKLWAFALASFMAGVAGGLYAGAVPKALAVDAFSKQAAIFLIAAVVMGGIDSLWGALLAGFLAACFGKYLTQNVMGHQFWNNFSLSLFGFGLLMNLTQSTKAMEKKGLLQ